MELRLEVASEQTVRGAGRRDGQGGILSRVPRAGRHASGSILLFFLVCCLFAAGEAIEMKTEDEPAQDGTVDDRRTSGTQQRETAGCWLHLESNPSDLSVDTGG